MLTCGLAWMNSDCLFAQPDPAHRSSQYSWRARGLLRSGPLSRITVSAFAVTLLYSASVVTLLLSGSVRSGPFARARQLGDCLRWLHAMLVEVTSSRYRSVGRCAALTARRALSDGGMRAPSCGQRRARCAASIVAWPGLSTP